MVPRPLAPAMRSCTCTDVIQSICNLRSCPLSLWKVYQRNENRAWSQVRAFADVFLWKSSVEQTIFKYLGPVTSHVADFDHFGAKLKRSPTANQFYDFTIVRSSIFQLKFWTFTHNLKPGSHMPPTYQGRSHRHGLRQHCGICEHLSPRHNLSQALTAGLPAKLSWVQLRRQAGDCWRWKYFMWTSSAVAAFFIKTIRPIFRGNVVENCAIRFPFRANLSMSATHRRCAGDPLGQVTERCQFQPTTTSQAGWRDMRTRLYPQSQCRCM